MAISFPAFLPRRLLLFSRLGVTAAQAESGQMAPSACEAATSPLPERPGTLVALQTKPREVQVSLEREAAADSRHTSLIWCDGGSHTTTPCFTGGARPFAFVVQGGDPQSADAKVPGQHCTGTGSFPDPPAFARPAFVADWKIALQGGGKPATAGADQIPLELGQACACNMNAERSACPLRTDPNSAQPAQFSYIALKPPGGSSMAAMRCSAVWFRA